jgi:hypothetical protein
VIEPAQLGAGFGGCVVTTEFVEGRCPLVSSKSEQVQQASTPKPAVNEVHGHAVEPGAKEAGIAQIGELLEGSDERVLHHVHRVVARAKKACGKREHMSGVAPVEGFFGAAIAEARSENEGGIEGFQLVRGGPKKQPRRAVADAKVPRSSDLSS